MPTTWNKQTDLVGLSPMDGVTDSSFRYITAKYGKPSVIFTEFVSAEGITKGAEALYKDLEYSEIERPIVVQLFGKDPGSFYNATLLCAHLGFDGVDINMGCPAKNVNQSGSGAALMNNIELAEQIIKSSNQALQDWANGIEIVENKYNRKLLNSRQSAQRKKLPLSIKTRTAYAGLEDSIDMSWFNFLAQQPIDNLTIHGRTYKQMYRGKANWESIQRIKEVVKEQSDMTVIGNGDVLSRQDGLNKIKRYNLDGVLIGRAACGNPWVFKDYKPELAEIIAVALEHSENLYQHHPRSYLKMRRNLCEYFSGIENIKELRAKLINTSNHSDTRSIIEEYFGII